jgi:hypothetical protein
MPPFAPCKFQSLPGDVLWVSARCSWCNAFLNNRLLLQRITYFDSLMLAEYSALRPSGRLWTSSVHGGLPQQNKQMV